jgi:polyhydroxybutyrate depolymerase
MQRRYVVLVVLVLTTCFPGRGGADDREAPVEHQFTWKGVERRYLVHAPRNRAPGVKAPLVLVLHGGGGNAEGTIKLTKHRWDELADRDGFVVVYPDAVDKNWNDGRTVESSEAHREKVDDVGYFSAVIDAVSKSENVDPRRIYATGISNGGFMSHRLGRELSSRIAAIAPVAANLQTAEDFAVVPSRAVSVLAINGTEDPLVPFGGGDVHFLKLKRGKCLSAKETIAWWVKVNGCAAEGVAGAVPDRDAGDGTTVRTETHGGGRDGTEVILYIVEHGGHTWPGGLQYLPAVLIGKTCRDFDASDVIWAFFKKHVLPE